MHKLHTVLLTTIFFFAANACTAQKATLQTWGGGHGCISLTLKLYTDSTYDFISESAMIFVTRSKRKGHYELNDHFITLYQKKRLSFFFFFSKKMKHVRDQYRIVNNQILMYTPEDEISEDSSYIKAYNTLYKEK